MRRLSIFVLALGLLAGCSSFGIGPHRIDVQQGNALDPETLARLKPGLSRSQVRFLLGTPLVVDPFRSDRWDYVYAFRKGGKLIEQRRLSLFFDGDALVRIEGQMPQEIGEPAAVPVKPMEATAGAETRALAPPAPAAAVALAPAESTPTAPVTEPARPTQARTSVVPPLPGPPNVPPYVDPHVAAEPPLQAATDVTQIKPDIIPPFPAPPVPSTAEADGDVPVLQAVRAWADAWSQREEEAYLAAYDEAFVPPGGGSRAEWEKRRRLLLGLAKNIELKIESPSVERHDDDSVSVTFRQFYRSDRYRDAVVKQLRMIERNGRWRIIEEKVLSILREGQL